MSNPRAEDARGRSSSIRGRNYGRYLGGHRPTPASCNLPSAISVRGGPGWDRAPHGLSTLRGVWAGEPFIQLRPRLLPYSLHRGAEPDMVAGREGSSYQVRLAPLGLLRRRFQPEMMPQRRAGIVEPVQAAPL